MRVCGRSCMSLCSRCDFFLNIYHWASSEVSGMWEETKYTAELTVLLHLIANTDTVIDPFAGHLCTAFSCCLIHHRSLHTILRPSKGFLVVLACCCCSSALMQFLWWLGWFTLTCDNSRYFFFFFFFFKVYQMSLHLIQSSSLLNLTCTIYIVLSVLWALPPQNCLFSYLYSKSFPVNACISHGVGCAAFFYVHALVVTASHVLDSCWTCE